MRQVLISLLLSLAFPSCADEFPYVYSRSEGSHTISRGSLQELLRLQERLHGEYLWARIGGREYVIRDAETLKQIRQAFAPLEELTPHQKALKAKFKPFEDRFERLEEEADALRDTDHRTAEQSARLQELEGALRKLELRLRAFEDEDRRFEQQEEALEKVFEAQLERIVRRSLRNGTATPWP